MSLQEVPAGPLPPEDLYGIIEIPAAAPPIKYEVDKRFGVIWVDRFIGSGMSYPCNYGYINQTLGLDGDPLDLLLPTPYPVMTSAVIRCRLIGVLHMEDEAGEDSKLIAVPHQKVTTLYKNVQHVTDLPRLLLEQIRHFFEQYKALEPGNFRFWIDSNNKREANLRIS